MKAPPWNQRLPGVALVVYAAAGVLLGRCVLLSGGTFAVAAAVALLLGARFGPCLPVGVALTFAAAQAWHDRDTPATALAGQLGAEGHVVTARFTVLEPPRAGAARVRCLARLDAVEIDGRRAEPRCPVLVLWNGGNVTYGATYEAIGTLRNVPPPRNPGEFDYAAWLANTGVHSQFEITRPADGEWLRAGGNPLVHVAIASRAWITRTLGLGIEGTPEVVLIRAMTVGDTSDAPDAMKDAFRETGTFHLFSVSGLHVGIVAAILWLALGACGVSQRASVVIIIPALFFYALLTGLSAASVRAATMLSFLAAGLLLDRPVTPLNSIGLAGFVILLGDSAQLFNPGFQLSFGAVTAIILIAPRVQRRLDARLRPDPFLPTALVPRWQRLGIGTARVVAGLFAVSLAAWIVSLPLTVAYFHLVSLSSIPANLVAVPMSSLALGLAAVALVAGLVSPALAEVFNQANFLLAKVLLAVVEAFAALPGSSLYVGPPDPPRMQARLTVLDASPGAATTLQVDGQTWQIDTGNQFFADSTTVPFLRSRGVNRLAALALTHGDIRHIGGAARVLEAFPTSEVLDSGLPDRSPTRRQLREMLRQAGVPVVTVLAGWSAPLPGGGRVRVLHPPALVTGTRADDKALVLAVERGPFRALLLADAGVATEQWLRANAADALRCDLVVVGHHVSSPGVSADFFRVAQPRAVIVSAADFPEREGIDPAWQRDVEALGIRVVRQDESGAATVTVFPDQFSIAPFLPPGGAVQTYPLFDASRPPR